MSTRHRLVSPILAVAAILPASAASSSLRDPVHAMPPARRAADVAAQRAAPAGDPSRRLAGDSVVEKRAPFASPWASTPTLDPGPIAGAPPSGPFPMSCAGLRFVLDGFGAFGASTAGGDAFFDAGHGEAATVYESMAFLPGVGFLDADALAMPQSAAGAGRLGDDVVAGYTLGAWRVELRSSLEDCAPGQAALRQEWLVTNVSVVDQPLAFTLYLDGDLYFRGAADDDFGAATADELFLFDEGADPAAPTAFVGLSSEAPAAISITREVGEYSEQRGRIARGAIVLDRLVRASGARADADEDGVTDEGFDTSLAIAHDFAVLAPGESRSVNGRIRWGVGAPTDVISQPLSIDAGPDRVVECEGRSGTIVRLDASASASADEIAEWTWGLGGVVAAEGVVAEILLSPGTHEIVLEAVDARGRIATDATTIEVVDSLAPMITIGAPSILWPPDHRLVPVPLPIEARDACSDTVRLKPIAVLSDEAPNVRGVGDGHSLADFEILDDGTVLLRRERAGGGDGRVYHVIVDVLDDAGNVSRADVRVDVPHDPRTPAVDSSGHVVLRP